ncbi:hypothetical protein E2542_SST22947 [Spatholobus suberectus]|nr:hypothetical protein E2542_SST22947 [Spatholobus suberectus]
MKGSRSPPWASIASQPSAIRAAARTSRPFTHVLSPLRASIYYAGVSPEAAAARNPDTAMRSPNAAAQIVTVPPRPNTCGGGGGAPQGRLSIMTTPPTTPPATTPSLCEAPHHRRQPRRTSLIPSPLLPFSLSLSRARSPFASCYSSEIKPPTVKGLRIEPVSNYYLLFILAVA